MGRENDYHLHMNTKYSKVTAAQWQQDDLPATVSYNFTLLCSCQDSQRKMHLERKKTVYYRMSDEFKLKISLKSGHLLFHSLTGCFICLSMQIRRSQTAP